MPARVLDGNRIRDQILTEVEQGVAASTRSGVRPGLAAVLVGDDPASQIYVRNKVKACERIGIYSEVITPPGDIPHEDLLALIQKLNGRDEIDGILVQLPLPPQIDSPQVLLAVNPAKDVDGFHPVNVGSLVTGRETLLPCTPAGLIEILRRSGIAIAGQRAVVIGRSNIVGKPAALLLLNENATVTVCHSKTPDLAKVASEADILVAAIGRPAMVTREFLKPGVTVLDVGINRITDPALAEQIFRDNPSRLQRFHEKGSVVVGDTHPSDVEAIAGAYTPVPGGVGPLTIAMLMSNTLQAARRRRGRSATA